MAALATIATIASTAISAVGTIAAGKAQAAQYQAQAQANLMQAQANKQAAEFEAVQLEMQGNEELAASQQEAEESRRRKTLALSTLQARAAGSGFTATDPTALNLSDEISKYGTLQQQMALYGGQSRKSGLLSQAAARRFEGETGLAIGGYESASLRQAASAARSGSYLSAAGTILGGISSMAGKYAKKPSTVTYG